MKNFNPLTILKRLLIAFLFIGSYNYSYAQVDVAATAGTPVGSYTTLKGAFDAINAGTHQGSIAISISANTTETAPAVLNSSGAGTALYTAIVISPSADGIVISSATATGRGVIELNGADNVTINGDNPNTPGTNRNLTIQNTAVNTVTYTSVIRIALSTLITSGDNNSVLNCVLLGNATGRNILTATSTTGSEHTTYGILVGGAASTVTNTTAPSALTSVNTTLASPITALNFIVSNNQIDAVARGISVNGAATTVATPLTITNNVIGNATAGNATTVYSRGISIQGYNNALISNNTIRNMEWFVSTAQMAIGLGDVTANGTNAIVEKNVVTHVLNRNTGTYGAYGINVAGGTNHIIKTNMVSDINHDMSGGGAFSTTFGVFGIRIAGGTGHQLYQNSVNLFGLSPGTASATLLTAACAVVGTGQTGCDIRNNIFSNTITGGTTSLAHVSFYLPTGGTSVMNLNLNNNAYYCGSTAASQGILQTGTTSSVATLYLPANFIAGATAPATNSRSYTSTLSAAANNDNASYASSNAAPFISNTDLHLSTVSTELVNVEQKGATGLTGVATDIDGNTRPDGATTIPDMGADEVTAPLACSGIPTAGTISGTSTICQGGSVVLTSNGVPAASGLSYQWKSSTVSGGPYSTNLGTSLTQNSGAHTATTYYIVTVTCSNSGLSASTPEFTVNVNSNPTISVTPSSATYCNPGTAVSLAATGASTYAWTPSTGLSANIGAAVNASPTASTTYTVTGIDGNGCLGSTTVAISVNNAPVISSVTAVNSAVCNIGNSQLQGNVNPSGVSDMVLTSGTGATLDPMTGATTVLTSGNDDTPTAAASNIGFTFPFNGTTYTQYSVSPDGWLSLGGAVATSSFTNQVTLATNNPKIYPLWDDLATGTNGNVQTLVTGTAPNRIFIVQWFVTVPRNTAGAANSTFQAWLYETSGVIEFRYGTMGVATSGTMSAGLTGSSTNFNSITYTTNLASSSVPNDNNAIVPATGTIYTFSPLQYTYSWTPSTFLNSSTIINPTVTGINTTTTYTFSASGNGCTSTANTTVTVNPLPSAPTATNSAQCGGQIPTASVTSTTGAPTPTFVWYDAAVGGTALQTSSSTTYTSVIGTTTTLYVAEKNMTTGCESALTPITITVASADLVQASVNNATICIGETVNLSVVNLNATPLQSYTYTWSSTAGNGLNTTTGSSVTATPTTPGSYVFTVNGVDGGCNAVSTVNVTVNPFVATVSAVNVTCNGAANGTFTLSASSCGTAPYTYSVDGGVFGSIPTNLTPGTYAIVTKDANGYTVAPQSITITEPNAITVPSGISNVAVCQNATSAQLTVPATATITIPVTFGLAAQPAVIGTSTVPTTVAGNPNVIATATLPALPAGATITSVTYTMNGLTPIGGSWASDVFFGFSGAYSANYANGTGAPGSTTAFNYTKLFTGGTYNPAGGTVELNYYDQYDDNVGAECTFTTGASAGTLTIIYTVNNPTVNWYSATTGGSLLGTGTPFETVGTSVLPSTSTPGTYTFYAEGTNGSCVSATRTAVTVTVNALPTVNAGADQAVCAGTAVTLNGTVAGGTWSGPVAVTNGTAFTPPAGIHTFTYSVTNVSGCTNTDNVVVTVNALPTVNAGTDQAVCVGTAVTLSGTVAGGTWSGPLTITDGVAFTAPVGVHTFTYSVTNVSGCTSTDDVIVTVNALPTVNAGTDQAVCEGTAVTLSGTVAGGTWSGPLTITDGVAFTAPVGVHTFTYSVTNVSGCTSTDDVIVTVNALPTVNAGTDQAVCEGTAVTLSGTVAGGTWSGPLTITDGVAFTAPVGVHTFTYSVTNASGCTNTDDVIVTVNALPTVNAGADQAVCEGTAVTLSGTVAGGTWSGPLTITDGVAFTAPVGVHTFTYSVTNASGCTSTDDVIVTVNALPTVNAGADQAVCEGTTVTLSGTVAGGTWSGPITITDGVAFTAPVGVHTFTYSVTNGSGCTNTDDVIVTVNALPTVNAGADQAVCEGTTVTLSGTVAGGTWSGPLTITDGVAFTAPVGVHTFTYSVTNGSGCTNTDDVVVTVNAVPVATATDNGDATITAGTAATYQWIDCATGTAIAGATSQTYTVTANGTYAVVVSNGSCSDTSACVTIDYMKVSELSLDAISIYPNPTRDNVTVTMSSASASIEIIDAQGKLLNATQVVNGDKIDLSTYETGMYIFRVKTENGTSIFRVSKN